MRARPATLGLFVIAVVALAACREARQDAFREESQVPADRLQKDAANVQGTDMPAPADPLSAMFAARKLIRTAQVSLEVTRFHDAAAEAGRIVEAAGGYVSESNAAGPEDGIRSGWLVLRIPGDRFLHVLERIKKVGKVRTETVSTEDVSRAYADLETRLRVKREAESRLRAILRGRTAKLSDILEVEQALMAVVEEIEQMEGQRRFYDHQVALSTIRIEISEPSPLVRRGALAPIGDALRDGVRVLVGSLASVVTLTIAALPWVVVLSAFLWIVRRTLRRRASSLGREASA